MSTPVRQKRPTREETRTRLLDAAIEVFVERGIAAASVEDIADRAGFSRGALYSNFEDKDDLILAVLQRMSDESIREIEELQALHPDPDDYIRATQARLFAPDRHVGSHHPVLGSELVLYAMRNPAAQPLLKERLDRAEEAVWSVIERIAGSLGIADSDNRRSIAAMIVAMDDGFSLHAIIDPSRDPLQAFSTALDFIAEAGAAIAVAERVGTTRQGTSPVPPKGSTRPEPGARSTAKVSRT